MDCGSCANWAGCGSGESFGGCQSWADRCHGLGGCIGCGSCA